MRKHEPILLNNDLDYLFHLLNSNIFTIGTLRIVSEDIIYIFFLISRTNSRYKDLNIYFPADYPL